MPAQLRFVSSDSLETSGGQTDGMIRQNAFVDVSDHICSILMIAKPHTISAVHHHGEQDTVLFVSKGFGTIVSEGGTKKQVVKPGDFAFIPAYAEHQEANEGDEDFVCIINRSGRAPATHNLEGWSKS